MTRYKFYREHKYVSAALNDVERQMAKADFAQDEEVLAVKEAFLNLAKMQVVLVPLFI